MAATKILLFTLILLVFACLLVAVKQRFEAGHALPASISGPDDDAAETSASSIRVTRQPTILQARPASVEPGEKSPSSPRYWEKSPADPTQAIMEQSDGSSRPAALPLSSESSELSPSHDGQQERRETGLDPAGQRCAPSVGSSPQESAESATEGAESRATPIDWPTKNHNATQKPPHVYTQSNDSLWSISQRVYGAGIYYRALSFHNRERIPRPDRIPAGVEVVTPPADELRRLYPELCPPAPPPSAG